jgi:archaellum component FlaC
MNRNDEIQQVEQELSELLSRVMEAPLDGVKKALAELHPVLDAMETASEKRLKAIQETSSLARMDLARLGTQVSNDLDEGLDKVERRIKEVKGILEQTQAMAAALAQQLEDKTSVLQDGLAAQMEMQNALLAGHAAQARLQRLVLAAAGTSLALLAAIGVSMFF